jgi:hypothetical protein
MYYNKESMNIVLTTALYPPDIAAPASYVKELARKLSHDHTVTIVTYGAIPEDVPNVTIRTVDKRSPVIVRLLKFFFTTLSAAKTADILYTQNGASVELPVTLVALITRKPLVYCFGDAPAHERAKKHFVLNNIEKFLIWKGSHKVTEAPRDKPEVHPLLPKPKHELTIWKDSWDKHVTTLISEFHKLK